MLSDVEAIRPTTKQPKQMTTTNEKYIGCIEIEANDGEFHVWEVVKRDNVLVVGVACNAGLLDCYRMVIEDGETLDEALQELHTDLEVEANDGAANMSRLH